MMVDRAAVVGVLALLAVFWYLIYVLVGLVL